MYQQISCTPFPLNGVWCGGQKNLDRNISTAIRFWYELAG